MNEKLKEDLLKLIQEKPMNYVQCCCSTANVELKKRVLAATAYAPEGISFKTRIFWILNNITDCPRCRICGKPVQADIYTLETGYNKVSKWKFEDIDFVSCDNLDCIKKTRSDKIKKTCLEKYGVENAFQAEFVKEKSARTCMERYGVKIGGNSQASREKAKQTCLEHYGVEIPTKSSEIIKKIKNTCLERYGETSYTKTAEHRINASKQNAARLLEQIKNDPEIDFTDLSEFDNLESAVLIWEKEFTCKCKKCGKVFKNRLRINNYYKHGTVSSCPNCHPDNGASKAEKDIIEFLNSIDVKNIELNSRRIIKPYEIDIYLKDSNLAIEYDGLYWHCSNKIQSPEYHLVKTDMCEKAGIRLIHIFEPEWEFKRKIVESRIKNMLGIYDNTIYARKCEIKQVDFNTSKDFQENNHLQGYARSSFNIGLFFNNELVSLMTFGKPRFSKKYEWELIRFCSRLGCHIPGAASKLLKYFEKTMKPKSLVSYADRRWSNGGVYKKLGFDFIHNSRPDYRYWNYRSGSHILESRIKYQKHKLKTLLSNYDQNLSELKNMENNGYFRIYDCGNMVFQKIYIS